MKRQTADGCVPGRDSISSLRLPGTDESVRELVVPPGLESFLSLYRALKAPGYRRTPLGVWILRHSIDWTARNLAQLSCPDRYGMNRALTGG